MVRKDLSFFVVLCLILYLASAYVLKTSRLRNGVKLHAARTVSNALDSPSVVVLSNTNYESNPMDSPSVVINGQASAAAINIYDSPGVIVLNKGMETVNGLDSPGVIFVGLDDAAKENAMKSPSLQFTSESKTKSALPLSLVVGHETLKSAMILLAVNPNIGGLVITGGKGTGKSAMAKALHRIMPPIEVIKGSKYNIAPDSLDDQIDDFLKEEMEERGKKLSDYETEVVPCPFVQVPVNVMEDRLFGSVDVQKTLQTGETVFTPGLLASAHRGVLYVDDINLLDTELTTVLLQALTDGYVLVEREGISVRYPCKPILIATFNTEGDDLKDSFLDRIGIALSADAEDLTPEQKVKAVNTVINFETGAMNQKELADAYEKEEQLKSAIVFAREYLKTTKISQDQIRYLCEEAIRGGCQGHRAEIVAAKVALAAAALEGEGVVKADDLRLAVRVAIVPRSQYADQIEDNEELFPPPPPPAARAPQPQNQDNNDQKNEENKDEEDKDDKDKEDEEEDEDDQEESGEPSIPEEFIFDAVKVNLENDLTKFGGRQKSGKGGKSGLLYSRDRGRFVRPVFPKEGEPLRLAIGATLREAAKNQGARRAASADPSSKKLIIEPSDVRAKLMARKSGCLLIFLVDASGSMAINRMNAAKGAALGLLMEAYQSRDKIALIPFQGQKAEVLLPPTRSIALAKNRLDIMPCGGGSPLAHALTLAIKTGLNAMSTGDVGRSVVVLISDGRANIPLDVSLGKITEEELKTKKPQTDAEKKEERNKLKEEVIRIAAAIGELPNFNLLVIDTENKFVSTGVAKEIADVAGGRYHFIPKASSDAMKRITSDAVSSLRKQNR